MDEILEVRWNDGINDEDIIEQFTDLGEAQKRVREIRAKYDNQSPRIWRK
jgi:hypothetical protein